MKKLVFSYYELSAQPVVKYPEAAQLSDKALTRMPICVLFKFKSDDI